MALLLGSVSFIVWIAPAEAVFILIMILLVEEPGATRKFGEEYLTYKRQVPMSNLRLDCLRMPFRTTRYER